MDPPLISNLESIVSSLDLILQNAPPLMSNLDLIVSSLDLILRSLISKLGNYTQRVFESELHKMTQTCRRIKARTKKWVVTSILGGVFSVISILLIFNINCIRYPVPLSPGAKSLSQPHASKHPWFRFPFSAVAWTGCISSPLSFVSISSSSAALRQCAMRFRVVVWWCGDVVMRSFGDSRKWQMGSWTEMTEVDKKMQNRISGQIN